MTANRFLDTNIIIYAAVGARENREKWLTAHDLLERSDICISGQVLAEFFVNCRKKTTLQEAQIFDWLNQLTMLPCAPVDCELVLEGVAKSKRYRISYWDGAIVAAAERLGATTLYTEDLNHDQTYGTVRAVNPFL